MGANCPSFFINYEGNNECELILHSEKLTAYSHKFSVAERTFNAKTVLNKY